MRTANDNNVEFRQGQVYTYLIVFLKVDCLEYFQLLSVPMHF